MKAKGKKMMHTLVLECNALIISVVPCLGLKAGNAGPDLHFVAATKAYGVPRVNKKKGQSEVRSRFEGWIQIRRSDVETERAV